MKRYVVRAGLHGVLCGVVWFLGWILYDEFELWRSYSSGTYQNYLLFSMAISVLIPSLITVMANSRMSKRDVRIENENSIEFFLSSEWIDAEDVLDEVNKALCFVFPESAFNTVPEWEVK